MAIKLLNIHKKFGDQQIHSNLNLHVGESEYHVILGSSGEGKTILLKMMAGFIKPDKGSILLGGEYANDLPVQERSIGYIFQDHALFPHLTVYENIAFGLTAQRFPKHEIRKRVAEYAVLVSLENHLRKYPSMLSGGQKQRVAMARALVLEPKILLLDEPLSSLDSDLRLALCHKLRDIHETLGITMVQVTHNLDEAKLLADTIHVLKNGKLTACPTTRQSLSFSNRTVPVFDCAPMMIEPLVLN